MGIIPSAAYLIRERRLFLYYSSLPIGTIRGFSSNGEVEVVPAISGQGWVLQPLVHGGVSCISGKSVRLIVKSGFANPATSSAQLSVLPVESQQSA